MRRAWLVVLVGCGAAPPTAPANRAEHVAAPVRDSDNDGIPDDRDRCPNDPEDYDTFADDDGCPDLDNDGDGVPDAIDDCPYDPGPVANRGCATACKVFIHDSDDCWADNSIYYDAHDRQQGRIAEVVKIVRANPTVQALTVQGSRAELVAQPLRAQLPGVDIIEDHTDIDARAIYVRIAKQRFGEGRFRAMECTSFGAIYHPARQPNCTR
jgi:hypothetical protein